MGVNASSIIKLGNLPPKCKDPGIFNVPCTIGNLQIKQAMADLGAGINVMPASLYRSLHFGELKPTGLTIQLANRSITKPEGVLEDILVKVNDLIFPADFYVLEMENDTDANQHTLILGRPFLKTARTKIDVYAGTLSMECGDLKAQFCLSDAMKFPLEEHSVFGIDVIDSLVEDACGILLGKDEQPPFPIFSPPIGCDESVVVEFSELTDTGTPSGQQLLTLGKKPHVGQKILLHEPQAEFKTGRSKSRWKGPLLVTCEHPCGAVELEEPRSKTRCIVGGHQLKYLHEAPKGFGAEMGVLWVEATRPP